jgi:PAS domain S-box-containing protein
MVRKDGTNFPAEFSARLIQFQGHRATSTVVRDITERRKSEKVLQESEEKYCSFFATSMDCLFITSRDGRWIDMNDAAVEFFGYESRDDLQKIRIPELYENPEEREKHTRVIEQQGFSKEFAVNLRKKDGSIVNALITSVARRDENGNIIGFQGTIRDITERRRVEEALRESEGNLRALFDAVLDGILMLDYSGEVLALNSALAKMFDLESANKAVGRNVLEFILPEFHDAVIKDLASVKEGRGGYLNSYKVRGISGKEFWVEGLGTDITYKGEHVNLVSVRDITERKRAEEQLERSFVDLAETVSRSMGTRDPYTASHQRRVAELARLVGEKMGLDGNRLMGLYIGGLLHDIGKISTPEAILSKPGKLTEEEWALIRAHAKQGYEILKDTDLP